ncbi:hypothetical protein [Bradyrhizobium sp. LB11.1]|uniref:hypothetical protein n=1 Tax=Bradyrhizobium sp. LB11.1 TaxID=3156326 RepID=UPI00339759EE
MRLFKAVPERMRETVTFDNGTEFASHLSLQSLLMKTFFCDPHAPWQKGGIENAIGCMRRFIPRRTDLDKFQPDASSNPSPPTTTPRANALTSGPQPRPLLLKCCTSSVNPPILQTHGEKLRFCTVTGALAELAATDLIALLVVFAVIPNDGIQKRTV